jgi:hypothetical protein
VVPAALNVFMAEACIDELISSNVSRVMIFEELDEAMTKAGEFLRVRTKEGIKRRSEGQSKSRNVK